VVFVYMIRWEWLHSRWRRSSSESRQKETTYHTRWCVSYFRYSYDFSLCTICNRWLT